MPREHHFYPRIDTPWSNMELCTTSNELLRGVHTQYTAAPYSRVYTRVHYIYQREFITSIGPL